VIYELWLEPSETTPATHFLKASHPDKARLVPDHAVLIWSVEVSSYDEAKRAFDQWHREHADLVWQRPGEAAGN
jgi:hypothetical protein